MTPLQQNKSFTTETRAFLKQHFLYFSHNVFFCFEGDLMILVIFDSHTMTPFDTSGKQAF